MSTKAEQTATVPFRFAAVQMLTSEDVEENLAVAETMIARAATEGARLVALPEYFGLLSRDEQAKVRIRERAGDGPMQAFLADSARRHGVWLLGGTVPLECDAADKVYNSLMLFSPEGERTARYDKIHLFGFRRGDEMYDEAATIESGPAQATVVDLPFARVGLAVCYDLRFPELFRAMGTVDLIVLPSAFTATTGRAHWEVLLRARAIENQCYVMAPAQGGKHASGRTTWGHTMIIDPWGDVVACNEDDGPGVVVADFDPQLMQGIRDNLPALQHRRL